MDNGSDATHLGPEDSHMDNILHNAFPDILDDGGGCVTNHVVSEDHLQGDLMFTEHAGSSRFTAETRDLS